MYPAVPTLEIRTREPAPQAPTSPRARTARGGLPPRGDRGRRPDARDLGGPRDRRPRPDREGYACSRRASSAPPASRRSCSSMGVRATGPRVTPRLLRKFAARFCHRSRTDADGRRHLSIKVFPQRGTSRNAGSKSSRVPMSERSDGAIEFLRATGRGEVAMNRIWIRPGRPMVLALMILSLPTGRLAAGEPISGRRGWGDGPVVQRGALHLEEQGTARCHLNQHDYIRRSLGPALLPYTSQGLRVHEAVPGQATGGCLHRYPKYPCVHGSIPPGPGDCLYETGVLPWRRG